MFPSLQQFVETLDKAVFGSQSCSKPATTAAPCLEVLEDSPRTGGPLKHATRKSDRTHNGTRPGGHESGDSQSAFESNVSQSVAIGLLTAAAF